MPACFTLAGTQSCTPLNTAVFMASCSSGTNEEREKSVKKGEVMKKSRKNIKIELMKIQKPGWVRRGRAEWGRWVCVLHAMTISALLCMSQQLKFSSFCKVFSPFTVWLMRAAVAVGTEFKKAALEFLCQAGTAGHGPPAERRQSPPPEPGQWLIWTARK